MNSYYTNYELEVIGKFYPSGGCQEVKKYINRGDDSIRHKAKELGIKRIQGFRCNASDITDFLNIQTENISYLLGFIWGDGCLNYSTKRRVYSINVTIQERDGLAIKEIFDHRWKMYCKPRQKSGWQDSITFLLNHKKLCEFLLEYGFKDKSKISPCKILSIIPNKLRRHFFRGWFDADGHFSKSGTCNIAGHSEQDWTALINLCTKLKIDYKITINKNKKGAGSSFSFGNLNSARRFMFFICKNTCYKLDRKYIEYRNFLKQHQISINKKQTKGRGIVKKRKDFLVYSGGSPGKKDKNKTVIIGNASTFELAKDMYDEFIYQKTGNIFLLHHPEKFEQDINFDLYNEQLNKFNNI